KIATGITYKWDYFVNTCDPHYRLLTLWNQEIGTSFSSKSSLIWFPSFRRFRDPLKTCEYVHSTLKKFREHLDKIQKKVDRLKLEGYSNLNQWVSRLDKQVEQVLLTRLQQAVKAWTEEFLRYGADSTTGDSTSRDRGKTTKGKRRN
ncbi:11549_t:CDS:2, partial [Paraglomus brasilianum]